MGGGLQQRGGAPSAAYGVLDGLFQQALLGYLTGDQQETLDSLTDQVRPTGGPPPSEVEARSPRDLPRGWQEGGRAPLAPPPPHERVGGPRRNGADVVRRNGGGLRGRGEEDEYDGGIV